jgi:lipopolysaccharide export system permease protein
MNTYTKFLSLNYIKSFIYVFFIMLSLVIILNILTEIEFFKNYKVKTYFPLYLAILNSFDLVFEMFPFIFLISTQVFFVNLFNNNEVDIFKYNGLQNSKIILILTFVAFFIGIFILILFYSLSSNFKNLYLEHKNRYSSDNKYLAVVTNNGLWIKDIVDNKTLIINANSIKNNTLENVNISEFDEDFNLLRVISSEKIDIQSNNWILYNSTVVEKNINKFIVELSLYSNFNFQKINGLFSNLSSLSIIELVKLRNNYLQVNYSTTEIDVQLHKLFSYPIYFVLMTILSSIIMFNTKKFKSTLFKIIVGLISCVIIYYINNIFYVLGSTEKISYIISVWISIFILITINSILILNINEK